MDSYLHLLVDEGPDIPGLPTGGKEKFQGPWFSTQLTLSLSVGLGAFLLFCVLRRIERFKVLYAPRTLIKGFSPHEVHDQDSLFGWLLPTLRTSEFVVLQLVGLDAAVFLSFLRTGFLFFLTCSLLAFSVLVPINYRENGSSEGVTPPSNHTKPSFSSLSSSPLSYYTTGVTHGSTLYLTSHLVFTYLFTILALVFLLRNWKRYIPLRQLFALELGKTIPARTVMCTALPPHLRSERALADYFESINVSPSSSSSSSAGPGERQGGGLPVESVVVTRAIGSMRELLERRTKALETLENAWAKYLGNPVPSEGKKAVFGYDREYEVERILRGPEGVEEIGGRQEGNGAGGTTGRLVDIDGEEDGEGGEGADDDLETGLLPPSHPTIVNEGKKRPTIRPRLFGKKVDALDYYAEQFRLADEAVKKRRKGKFRPTGVAFVTFQNLAAAQIVAQTVHYPSPTEFHTELAPEPRDIHWFNLNLSGTSVFVRQVLVLLIMLVFLSLWSIPVVALVGLLSWETIKDVAPRFAKLLSKSPRLRSLIQTSLPSLAIVAFNNLLPMFLEWLSVFSGLQARSWIELSQLKKYHISLLFTTLFVVVTASTYQLLRDISDSPAAVVDKLATALQQPNARNFFVSYVMFAGLGIMPLQLLELATVFPRAFFQLFLTRTPREHAALNAPTMVNLGVVWPQALLIWTLGLTYSIITPLILPFATLYFGLAYLVYKYRFLFVFYRPYESRGQAWPLAYNRVGLGLLIFQVFMLGLFTARKAFLLSGLMIPLLAGTSYTIYRIGRVYGPLAHYVSLSQACESAGVDDVVKLRQGHPVTNSQTELSRGRYGQTGEGVYAVAKNPSTDYSQPPLSESYPGVLNTGSRRYGHPALFGSLPTPWLPVPSDPPESSAELPKAVQDALVVVDIRRGWRNLKRAAKRGMSIGGGGGGTGMGRNRGRSTSWGSDRTEEDPSRAWRGASGDNVVQSPIGHAEMENEEEEEDMLEDQDDEGRLTRYSTFFPHRQGQYVPGHFPPSPADMSDTDDEGQ
ncbi:hypothetical protein JCM8547_002789 [Rhodosporidiobolus lusitaniae]